MIRTQIHLPEKEYEELRQAASSQKRSMADCIREAIRLFLSRQRTNRARLEEIAGKFRPVPMSDLKPHDRWTAEAILRSKGRRKKD